MRKTWPWLTGAVLLLTCAVGYLYHNPFWLVERSVNTYLHLHGVQSRYVQVNGQRIHYLEAGPAEAARHTVVLVHGLGARAADWAPMLPVLAAHGNHVYALDLLGYGDSDKPADGDFSLRGELAVVTGFMQALHVPKADVGGWSMGGWISMLFALEHPDAVRRLMLFDSAGLYFDPDFDSSLFSPSDRAGLERLLTRLEPDKPIVRLPGFAVHGLVRRMQESRWIVERSFRSMISGREVLNFRVSRLKMPVLIVWGLEDKLTTFEQAERLHQSMPQSVLAGFRGCGHLAAAECADRILPVVLRFLDAEPAMQPSAMVVEGRSPYRKLEGAR